MSTFTIAHTHAHAHAHVCAVWKQIARQNQMEISQSILNLHYIRKRGELRQSKRWVGDREQLGLRYFHVFEKAAEVSLFLSNMHRKGRVYMVPFSEKKP